MTMDALTLLQGQATITDELLTQVFAPVTADQGAWRLPGGTANAIAPTFIHAYHSEDRFVSARGEREPLFVAEGWGVRLGFDPAAPWGDTTPLDPALCRDYARAICTAAERYLAALDPATLAREVETPRGRRPLGEALSLVLVIHKGHHMGEIAALLGCQGERGFPF